MSHRNLAVRPIKRNKKVRQAGIRRNFTVCGKTGKHLRLDDDDGWQTSCGGKEANKERDDERCVYKQAPITARHPKEQMSSC